MPYPFNLTIGWPCQLALCLAGNRTLHTLYREDSLYDILGDFEQNWDGWKDQLDGIPDKSKKDMPGEVAAMRRVLNNATQGGGRNKTLYDLLTTSRDNYPTNPNDPKDQPKPKSIMIQSNVLRGLGFLLPHNHVSDDLKALVKRLFDRYKLVDTDGQHLGAFTMEDLFTKTAAQLQLTERQKRLIFMAKELGVLEACPADPLMAPKERLGMRIDICVTEPNGKCLNDNGQCQAEPNFYCEGGSAMSEPCP